MKGSSDVADGEAVLRPLSTPLHVADHCKMKAGILHVCKASSIGSMAIAWDDRMFYC